MTPPRKFVRLPKLRRADLLSGVAAPILLCLVVLIGWQTYVWISDIRPQVLPGPIRIVRESIESADVIAGHAAGDDERSGRRLRDQHRRRAAAGPADRPFRAAAPRRLPLNRRLANRADSGHRAA